MRAFKDLKRIAEDYKPDIIHVHSSKAGVLGRLAFTGHYKKLYYTPHGYSFLMQDSFALKRALYWIIEKAVALTHSTTIWM
ncbi:putative glycosyltransferase [Lacticaseibacillus paracasei subsp. paracasei]|nr:alpha(1,3)galactosyltransferase EpsF [Lacticaseibacillus paracasei subsp. paracasei ATCC 25302 = DSM 5622 = JCM 8130]BAN72290.1 putative glycosyltransferase [Lacticaseibacillus paracasei subsp. paracasei]